MSTSSRRVALIGSATAVALLTVEAGLRLSSPPTPTGNWLTTSEQGYAVNRRSTAANHAMPGRSVRYHLDSHGFRGAEPANHGRRVLVLGDSVTFGLLLNEADTAVARLASNSDQEWGAGRVSFVNAAVGGWGTADYAAFIEDRGDELRPDAVLVFVGFDDVSRTWRSPLWASGPNGTVSRRSPSERRPGLTRVADLPGYRHLIERSHVAQLMRQTVIAATQTVGETIDERDTPESLRLMEALFARMTEWCRARGIPLLVTNGTLLGFEAAPADRNPNATFLENAETVFSRLGVPYLSVARAHGPLAEPLQSFRIPDDGHPNERGAQLIAAAVWPWLREQLRPIVELAPS